MNVAARLRRPLGGRRTIGLILAAGLLAVAGANAHLVYVAVTSQPDCVAHVIPSQDGASNGTFSAAKSSCSPGARS